MEWTNGHASTLLLSCYLGFAGLCLYEGTLGRMLKIPCNLDSSDASLALSLGDSIDPGSINSLRQKLRNVVVAPRRLFIDCASVRRVDPVGAALLWQFCGQLERETGTRVVLIHLSPAATYPLRSHPLVQYVTVGEELFQDPFSSPLPSNR